MTGLIASSHLTLVVGAGATGLSVARYFQRCGQAFCLVDEKMNAERAELLAEEFPQAKIIVGEFDFHNWQDVTQIILSPGVPRAHPAIQQALGAGISVIGDIELFAREANAPVVAITGSNGKSTVTTLLGEMAKQAGLNVAVGGNLGTPALDLLGESVELYVLELSSFQLESTESLVPAAATVLNISQDHLDRYKNLSEYFLCKQKIYHRAKHIVVNKDDIFTQPPVAAGVSVSRVTLGQPDIRDYGLIREDNTVWLARGVDKLIPADHLKIRGRHNLFNALAAIALGRSVNLPEADMIVALREFRGLSHRCQLVKTVNGVDFINDSKATNVGAVTAALSGLASGKNVILLAGGEGKGADFSELRLAVKENVKHLIVFGRDATLIAEACDEVAPIVHVNDLSGAVKFAHEIAQTGDVVLLSPACASFDMFKSYQDRGEQYSRLVEAL